MTKVDSEISIPEFYNGKSVLVTGGMGFLGKVIVEKLLRSCPGIENIYLIARSKKGKNVSERHEELIKSEPFAPLREKNPKVFDKIVMIEGDTSAPELGISKADQKLLRDKVSIFIHSAATIYFNEPLEIAVRTNLQSVKEIMELARSAKKCDALVHVSTAYTNWFESDEHTFVKEELYPNKLQPNEVIRLVNTKSPDELAKILPSLLGKHTNTYTFTKNLAEHLIMSEGKDLPVSIIRPSMVLGSLKEPMPGWIDSWAGPTSFVYLVSRGFLRSFHVHKNNVAEIVPVDTTVNLIVASAWKAAANKNSNGPIIYHSTTGANPINWKYLFDRVQNNARNYPLDDVFWYPKTRYRQTNLGTKIDAFITQRIPAYFVDFLSILAGKKERINRLHDKMEEGYLKTKFSSTNPIKFECKNYATLIGSMNATDVKEFDFDVRKINWKQYIDDYYLGARKYMWRSKSTDFEAGRRKIAKLKFANYCLVGTSLAGTIYLLNKARIALRGEKELELGQIKARKLVTGKERLTPFIPNY